MGDRAAALAARPVAASVDELLRGATERTPMLASDSKSGARFERVIIDGRRYVVKYLSRADDWIMRATGDLAYRPLHVWQSGILDLVPASIDHAFEGAAHDGDGAAILLEDLAGALVPEGDDPISLDTHLGFMRDMAAFHAAFWGWDDEMPWMCPLANRYTAFGTGVVECERALGFPEAVPRIAHEGWTRFAHVAGDVAPAVLALLDAPDPLVAALEEQPQTFLHGDWKMGNLGRHADGRTLLIDWANPGVGPGLVETTWYLALNRARLPEGHTKEDSIAAYRDALEGHGIDTDPWWDRTLALCLLGTLVIFGWEKALGDEAELAWWVDHAREGLRLLDRTR